MALNHHVYFDQVYIELNEEIQKHQGLMINLLQLPKDSPVELKLGEIAAYVGIILDGVYTPEDVTELVEEIVKRLRKAREELIFDIAQPINDKPTIN